ncbi:MAG TPA: sugar-binding domain-containing protein, partial [Chitinophagaceae bacterium]
MLGLTAVHPAFSQAARVKTNIDFDWYFHLGDIANGQSAAMDNSQWRRLDLPHDFSIEGSYRQTNPAANAFLPGGTGWYRKTIRWESAWKNKEVSIVFDGVYMNSEVWINGHYLGKRPNGYIGFKYDLTPYLKYGENAIAVKVDNSGVPSARWYTGSGIYRHVWLLVTNPIHVAWQGSFVRTPEVNNAEAAIHLDALIKNGSDSKTKVMVT